MIIRLRKKQAAKLIVTHFYFRGQEIVLILPDNNNS